MNRSSRAYHALTWLAACGFSLPAPAALGQMPFSSTPTSSASAAGQIVIRDVALSPGGLLIGQVVDTNLRPVAGAEVAIFVADTAVATSRTDASGTFAVTGLRGGTHQVVAPHGTAICRLWAPGTAPPCATNQLAIIEQRAIVRGQAGPRFRDEFFPHAKAIATHPLVVGGLIAAAIAIPAALHNADRAPGS